MRNGLWRTGIVAGALLTLATAAGSEQSAAGEKKTRVEVRGLRIAGKGYGDDQMMRPFNWSYGTVLALLLISDEGGVIAFDEDKSVVLKCRDDRGTNLLEEVKEEGFAQKAGFGGFPDISPDGKACLLELRLQRNAAPGATVIEAAGILVVTFATEKETHRQTVALKNGEIVSAGPITFQITKIGKPEYSTNEGDGLSFALEAKQDLGSVAEITFFDSEGQEIESSSQGQSRWGIMGGITEQWAYNLKRKVENVTIAVTRWTDMAETRIPFSVKVTLGL
ncbi:MAG: hypothetical protein V1789_12440 [PVC group bacterium]